MKRNKGIFIRLSDKELEVINSAWFDYIGMAGKPVSKSEFIRLAVKVFCARIISVIPPEEANDDK